MDWVRFDHGSGVGFSECLTLLKTPRPELGRG